MNDCFSMDVIFLIFHNNGLIFISVFTKWNNMCQTHKMKFIGSRNEIRKKIVKYIVEYLDFDF